MPDEPKPCPKAWCPFMGCSACEYQGGRGEDELPLEEP